MNIELKNIDELKPYKNNPRKNDNAVEVVAKSIEEFGFKVPMVIDSEDNIVCGHTRYEACKKLGIKVVPCVIADDLDEEQIKAFRLVDNKTSELSDWDFSKLEEELNELKDVDMSQFDFDLSKIEDDEIERKDLSDNIKEDYAIVIDCDDEYDLEEKYNELLEKGYKCRIL